MPVHLIVGTKGLTRFRPLSIECTVAVIPVTVILTSRLAAMVVGYFLELPPLPPPLLPPPLPAGGVPRLPRGP